MEELKKIIDAAYERRHQLTPASAPNPLRDAVAECIRALDQGRARVAENKDGRWIVNEWLKKAVLLSFKLEDNHVMDGDSQFFERVRTSFPASIVNDSQRSAPASCHRQRCAVGVPSRRTWIVMPTFINVGAYVDDGTMVDTWATVGSCAQIGKNVHLSGGVGIGGVLEAAAIRPDHYRRLLLHRGSIRRSSKV